MTTHLSLNREFSIQTLLGRCRTEFHTMLIPSKDSTLPTHAAQINLGALNNALGLARLVGDMLDRREAGAAYDILGTTPEIVEDLRRLYQNGGDAQQIKALLAKQEAYNRSATAHNPVIAAILPYTGSLVPPQKKERRPGFGS